MTAVNPKPMADRIDALSEEAMSLLLAKVRRAVRRSCPPYLGAQAEDIAQEVMIQLHRKLKKNEGKVEFSSIYILKAAHGATVDEIRRRCRRREGTGMEEEMKTQAQAAPDPERESLSRALGQEIRSCLETVIPSRREAVTLYLLGCPVSEIAHRLACREKSADNRVYRGMKDLRQCLLSKGIQP